MYSLFISVFSLLLIVEKCPNIFAVMQRPGRCPGEDLPMGNLCSNSERDDCYYDTDCSESLKCCENTCGISKCMKPIQDISVTRKKEPCPRNETVVNSLKCKQIETKFCYIENCQRCCLHENTCNPYRDLLTTVAICYRDLCRKKICLQQGSLCQVNRRTNAPECVCKHFCPRKVKPVCGSDHRTYDNECFMDKLACEQKKDIKVAHSGACVSLTKVPRDLCHEQICLQQGSHCQVNRNTDVAECVCKLECPKEVKPLCGSDHKTYQNECFMDKSACKQKKDIRVAHSGGCISSTKVPRATESTDVKPRISPGPTTIQVGASIELNCSTHVKEANLKWRKKIGMNTTPIPDLMIRSTKPNFVTLKIDHAVLANSGTYVCEMFHNTQRRIAEVELKVENESTRISCPNMKASKDRSCLSVARDECSEDKDCPNWSSCCIVGCSKLCWNGKPTVKTDTKGTRISCPNMKASKDRSCRSVEKDECSEDKDCPNWSSCCIVGCSKLCWNGKPTVKTDTKAKTLSKPPKELKCGLQTCKYYAQCQRSKTGETTCACPEGCNFNDLRPVCGVDMETKIQKTYASECFLKITACRWQKEISFTSGPCGATTTVRRQEPQSLCQFRRCPRYAKCIIQPFNHLPYCLCPRICDLSPSLVCGSDGRTYLNDCVMRVKSCRRNFYITKVSDGSCMGRR